MSAIRSHASEPTPGSGDVAELPPELAARDIVVRYGGKVVLDHVCIHADHGEVLGLLGPNGAGKTTLFDVLSGHLRPDRGAVELRGMDVTALRPEHRAQLGIGRTFQQARLFDDLTVLECVQVGLERGQPSDVVASVLALPPSWRAERRHRQRAAEILELFGLGAYKGRLVSELSTGMRRITELACVVAVGADVILLDEPTAGIAQAEIEQFVPVIDNVRTYLDATIVIIEHDIPLLMSLTDRLYVLAAGGVIAEGPPEVVRTDQSVIDAYLGTDHRVVDRSGRDIALAAKTGARRPAAAPSRRRRRPLVASRAPSEVSREQH
jgi:ABC-type branched-subunit amino acid transport system ATPase component